MNSTLKLGAVALFASSLGGCLIVDADVRESDFGGFSGGLLYAAEVSVRGPAEISIVAHSNGCTQKEDFGADVHHDDGRYRVRFERNREDNCKAFVPEGRRMTWSFRELGIPEGSLVTISNRVGR
jgi:hypothetical protein